jgi:hypothetical protein
MQQRPYLTLLSPPALSLRLGPALTPPSPPGRRVGEATPAAALASISDDTVLLDVLALDALGPGALPQLRALVRPWTESLLAPRLATACAWAVSDAVALPRRTAVIVALCQVWVRHAPLRPGAAEPSAPSPAPAPALLSGSPCGSSARVPSSPASTPSTAALVSSPIPWSPAAAVAPSAVPGLAAAVAALVDITADVGSGPSTGRPHALVREALLAFVDAFAVDTQPVRRTAARVVPAPSFLTGTRARAHSHQAQEARRWTDAETARVAYLLRVLTDHGLFSLEAYLERLVARGEGSSVYLPILAAAPTEGPHALNLRHTLLAATPPTLQRVR